MRKTIYYTASTNNAQILHAEDIRDECKDPAREQSLAKENSFNFPKSDSSL